MPPVKKVASTAKKAAAPSAKVAAAAKKAAPPKKAAAPAKKAAASVKVAPQVTITLKQIAAELAEGHDLPKKQAEAVLNDLVTLATQHLKKGDKNPTDRSWYPSSAGATGTDGEEPGDRRSDKDRREQEDRLPASERTEGGGLTQSNAAVSLECAPAVGQNKRGPAQSRWIFLNLCWCRTGSFV
jgi:hypothetical protein